MKNFLVDTGFWNCIETLDSIEIDAELDPTALAKINLSIKPIAFDETKKSAKTARLGRLGSLFRIRTKIEVQLEEVISLIHYFKRNLRHFIQ